MAKSGINYAGVEALETNVKSIQSRISNIFQSNLCGEVVNKIADCYSGVASESYRENFTTLGNKADEIMTEVSTQMQSKLQEFREAYSSQDTNLS